MTVKELVDIVNDGRHVADYIYKEGIEEKNEHKSDALKHVAKVIDRLVRLIEDFNVNDD